MRRRRREAEIHPWVAARLMGDPLPPEARRWSLLFGPKGAARRIPANPPGFSFERAEEVYAGWIEREKARREEADDG